MLEGLPARHQALLSGYEQALPEREWEALRAWLTTFYRFQLEWLLEPERLAACNKSRQIGMSHTTAAVAVLWGAFHGELTTVISIGERESAEVLTKAKGHRDVLVTLGSHMAIGGGQDAAQGFNFASGGRVLALPSSGGRSFTGNVFLDEYAYQQHADDVWDAALAVTLHGGRARVASTPNGIGNAFHQLITDERTHKGWALHEISIERAIQDGMSVDLDFCWSLAKGDERLFNQMFRCAFLDAHDQYIPGSLVTDACIDDLYTYEGEFYAGLDIGRSNDHTVLTVVRLTPDWIRWVQFVDSCKRTDVDALDSMVERAFTRYRPRRLCVDSTGIGEFPAERMQKRYGSSRVVPVRFTLQSKEELATGMYQLFAERRIRLPKHDEAFPNDDVLRGTAHRLRQDICSIRREITNAGNVTYDAPRTSEGHADSAWSLALALHGCAQPKHTKQVITDGSPQEVRAV